MSNKKYIYNSLIISSFIVAFVLGFNFVVDPYGVFNNKPIKGFNDVKNHTISEKMTKFYQAKNSDFDILLIGTSRMEHINPKYIEKYINGKAYNLGLQGSGISTQYTNIKYFIKNKNIHFIVLGLDFFSFSPENIDNYKKLEKTRYTDYYLKDYMDSLFSIQTLRRSFKTILESSEGMIQQVNSRGWDTEYYNMKKYTEKGEPWLEKRVNNPIKLSVANYNSERFRNPKFLKEGLEILDKIVKLCKENNIKLYMFTSPLYKNVYDVIEENGCKDSYDYWKKSLRKYKNIYDFSYKNSITLNYRNYVDPSHYQSHVGDLILKRIFRPESSDLPEDFGVLLD
ncbi:hypothetical protein [Halarcobacter ebronensis]|uniref:Uncharacterized protein n=1 Tax=Halarcobacter ebronensis TaxID=1462615 RepID=A0A4Q1AZ46_9BACT|nr:hypothetical protein [Halarcobacter ebronensis]QKF82559.1 hypothetical protein AEBR_2082 [Halarcobacter ebronensis]RXK07428.1 hypothetical protein CRV07_02895 [Halarcobacter ebronensis]